jgi:hypothetical protein
LAWTSYRRGRYIISTQTIRVGRNSWRGAHTVIHEFAHHLDTIRKGGAQEVLAKYRASKKKRFDSHGPSFTEALEDCVDVALGDQTLYSWDTEYQRVKKAHHRITLHTVQSTIQFDSLSMAAEPIQKSVKRVEAARKAWACPCEENNWLGGHLWRRKKERK